MWPNVSVSLIKNIFRLQEKITQVRAFERYILLKQGEKLIKERIIDEIGKKLGKKWRSYSVHKRGWIKVQTYRQPKYTQKNKWKIFKFISISNVQ